MVTSAVIAAIALLGGFAQTDGSIAPPVQESAKPQKICKRVIPTGSILPIKICLTNPEWKEFTQKTNSGAEQFLDRRQTSFCRDAGSC